MEIFNYSAKFSIVDVFYLHILQKKSLNIHLKKHNIFNKVWKNKHFLWRNFLIAQLYWKIYEGNFYYVIIFEQCEIQCTKKWQNSIFPFHLVIFALFNKVLKGTLQDAWTCLYKTFSRSSKYWLFTHIFRFNTAQILSFEYNTWTPNRVYLLTWRIRIKRIRRIFSYKIYKCHLVKLVFLYEYSMLNITILNFYELISFASHKVQIYQFVILRPS